MYQIPHYRIPWRLNHSQSSHNPYFGTCPSMSLKYSWIRDPKSRDRVAQNRSIYTTLGSVKMSPRVTNAFETQKIEKLRKKTIKATTPNTPSIAPSFIHYIGML